MDLKQPAPPRPGGAGTTHVHTEHERRSVTDLQPIAPRRPGHAPGWTWRKDTAGRVDRPWAWSEINGGIDAPARLGGLCESGWHEDCPQAPLLVAVDGCCSCPCHQAGGAA